jgi:hypothetical protein
MRYLEQAVEHGAQDQDNGIAADALWVEAAQTAVEMEDFSKAHGYLVKALAHNAENPAARQLLRDLPLLGMAR